MSLTLDPATTAVVFIDLQYGVVGRQLAPHDVSVVLKNSAALAERFRAHSAPVIYVRVLVGEMLDRQVDQSWPRGTGELPPNVSEVVPESGYQAGDHLVSKRSWGAFFGTDLEQILRRRGVKAIVLGGIATNFGVESTAREAYDRGYELVFPEDALSSMSAEHHAFAIQNIFPRMGRIRSTEEILAAL